MKKLLLSGWLCFAMLSVVNAQFVGERSGYEGDYFSLEGALDLFQNSKNLKQFERKLNREDSWVNNLDLNYDGQIDYIRVEHNRQGNFHAIVLQAIISRYEIQDVAVIEIEKISRYDAILQIVGDADLYGEEVIVESQRNRDNYASSVSYRGYDNVYYWEPVQYIFAPRYVVYVSPYRWSYYPTWWSPWRQCAWNVYYPRVVTYHNYYHVVNVHRVVNVHNYYYPSRTYCDRVSYRATQVRRQHGHSNAYRSTYKKNNTSYAKAVGNSSSTSVRRSDSRQVRPASQGKGVSSTTSVRKPASQGVRKPSTTSVRKPSSQGVRKPSTTSVRKPSSQGKGVSSTSVRRPDSRQASPSSQGVRKSSTTSVRKPSSQGTVKKPRNHSQSGHRATNMGSSTSRSRTSAVSKKPTNRSNQVRSQRSSSARSSAPSRSSRSVKPAPSRQRSSASSQRPSQKATPSRSSASRKSSAASSAPRKQYTAPKKSTPRASSSSKRSSTSRSVKPAAKPRAKSSSSARKTTPSKRGGRG